MKSKFLSPAFISVLTIFVSIIAVNVISNSVYFRSDITEESLYTLSDGTRQIVKKLDEPVYIKLYHSKSLANIPITYKNYAKRVYELLKEYESINPEKLTVQIFDPKPDSEEQEAAEREGLVGAQTNEGSKFYLGVSARQAEKESAISFLDPRKQQNLEYDLSQLILEVSSSKDKVLGIMSSLPVLGTSSPIPTQQNQPKWAFVKDLEKTYEIQKVSPDAGIIEKKITTLMVIHPKKISEMTQYAIDQFVMRGGELIVIVDPSARIDEGANMMAKFGQAPQNDSDLPKLFKHWGIDYNPKKVLGDKQYSTKVNTGAGVVPYALWQSLTKQAFNQELIATKDLDEMLIIEPGAFKMKEKSPLKMTPLIESSASAGFIQSFMLRFSNPLKINQDLKSEKGEYAVAGILNGDLTSAFDKPPENNSEDDDSEEKNEKPKHISKSTKKASILLITDVDFLGDQFSVNQFQMLGQVFTQPKNDNLNFLLNMVEFLRGAEEMMVIRSRGQFNRPFTKIIELEKSAQQKYQAAEARLQNKLRDVEQKLSKLKVDQKSNKIILTKEQHDRIKQFNEEKVKVRKELREIRKLLREDKEQLISTLTLINLFLVPVFLVIIGTVVISKRYKRMKLRT